MRKLFFLLSLICGLLNTLSAQTDDNRTVSTKIADLLAKSPAEDSAQLSNNARSVAGLGEAGIVELAKKLDEGGDETRVEFSIDGFSDAATQQGRDDWRSMAVKAYGTALGQVKNAEARLFLIAQLEQTGKDDAIGYLQPYLRDERLSDPAARALATINTDASRKALTDALAKSTGQARLSIIQALGDTRYAPAAQAVTALVNSGDDKLSKVSLYTLAQIADPASEKTLAEAAAKSNYTYSTNDATASYLAYLANLARAGKTKEAEKSATALLQKASSDKQVHTRTAALKILTDIKGEASTPLLIAAMKDKNLTYREAALKYAQPFLNETTANSWISTLAKSPTSAQTGIVRMLGNNKVASALPAILKFFQSKDTALKAASIAAAGKIGGQQAVPALLALLKSGNADEIAAVKSSLLSMKGGDITSTLGDAMTSASPAGKAAIIDILGARAVDSKTNDVLALANSDDTAIRKSARNALKQMAGAQHFPQLNEMLLAAKDSQDISDWQQILVAAADQIKDSSEKTASILSQLKAAPDPKKYLYYNVLAGIGGKQALPVVANAFATGDNAIREQVVGALSNWKSGLAASQLYHLLETNKDALTDKAFQGLIRQISLSQGTPDVKLILLRDAMSFAQNDAQKKQVLRQVERCQTFPALLFAGKFLDEANLRGEAASAVMNIALSDKSIYGSNVRQLLETSIGSLEGSESGYQKEAIRKHLAEMPQGEGFIPLLNGKDLSGWKGLVADPIKRSKMDAATLAKEQQKADETMRTGWSIKDGLLIFNGKGENLCTEKKYGDFEMYVDWKITKDGDAGIYLRGTPQVQIWDTSRTDVGAQVGSGGLYNNEKNPSKPSVLADNAIGDWNTFHIKMVGDLVTVHLNGILVVNGVPLENYWDRSLPIFPEEQIELQAHGTYVAYRDLYIREIPRPKPYTLTEQEKKEGFKILFDGTSLHEWVGNKTAYTIEDGNIAVYPKRGGNGNLYTKDEYGDFIYRFEFKLTPGANNGVGVRAPLTGDAAYEGMEIQILDDSASIYKDLQPYQFHGSVYGILAAKRGHLKPVGEWNEEEITLQGNKITVKLNGTVIVEGDIAEASKNGTPDHREHPGLKRTTGHIGFLGHGDTLFFRNIRIKDLSASKTTKPGKASGKKKNK